VPTTVRHNAYNVMVTWHFDLFVAPSLREVRSSGLSRIFDKTGNHK